MPDPSVHEPRGDTIVINGVEVAYHDDLDPTKTHTPIRATIDWMIARAETAEALEGLERLRAAGITHIPVFRSEWEARS
jgi:hypothetical protein